METSNKTRQTHQDQSIRLRLFPLLYVSTSFLVVIFCIFILIAWVQAVSWIDIALFAGFYLLTIAGITVGYHRLFTHRAFKASPATRRILGILGAMAGQATIRDWVSRHRQHHRFADEDNDLHSPHRYAGKPYSALRGFWYAHVAWMVSVPWTGPFPYVADLERDPIVQWVDRWYLLWVALGFMLPALIGFAIYGDIMGAVRGAIWGGVLRLFIGLHLTSSINSFCHLWGQRPHKNKDHSTNRWLLGFFVLGEGWHNNHHAAPRSAQLGYRYTQPDIGWWIILGLQRLKLVWDVYTWADARKIHSKAKS